MGLLTFWTALLCFSVASESWAASIVPDSYALNISINSTSNSFSGTVDITGSTTVDDTSTIELQSANLTISTVQLIQNETTKVISSFTLNDTAETLTISLNSSLLTSTEFNLSISFSGVASSNQSGGLYSYTDDGYQFFVANLYPSYARKLFPCFDDVGSKAVFNLTLSTTLSGAISNAEQADTSTSGTTNVYTFSSTPAIPPSSFFFIVGPLEKYYTTSNQTIWLSPSFNKNAFNTDIYSALTDELYQSFFTQNDMTKLDIVVIPELQADSYSGYGVVVYNTDVLQVDYAKSTSASLRKSLVKMFRGLFKIFYGTLTSPASWSENYISDSVATFLSYAALSSVESDTVNSSNAVAYFFEDVMTDALDLCTSTTTVVSQTTLNTSSEIEEFVVGSSMTKGAAILQMMSSVVSNMTGGLLDCFSETKQLANGVTSLTFMNCLNDFWASESYNLTTVFSPWLSSGGCPLIVTQRSGTSVSIVQEEIELTSSTSTSATNSASALVVPVTTESNATGFTSTVVYTSSSYNSASSVGTSIDSDSWVVIDANGQGLYRTQYDTDSWSTLTDSLSSNISILSSSSRAKLLSDAFWVAKEVDNTFYETLPDSILFLTNDTSLAPWKTTVDQLRSLWNWIYHTGTSSKSDWEQNISSNFTDYATSLMFNTYVTLGVTPSSSDSDDTKSLRKEIMSAMCDFNYTLCLTTFQQQFQNWISGSLSPTSDMFGVIVCNGLKTSTYSEATNWLAIYNTLEPQSFGDDDIRVELYQALACAASNTSTGNSSSIEKFLSIILLNSTRDFPINDVPDAFRAIYRRPEHTTQALTFFLQNQPSNLRTDLSEETQVSMMEDLAQYLTLDVQSEQIEWYIGNYTNATDFLSAVEAAQTTLKSKISWIKAIQSYVHAGLDSNYDSTSTTTTASSATSTDSDSSTSSDDSSTTATPSSDSSTFCPSFVLFLAVFSFYLSKF